MRTVLSYTTHLYCVGVVGLWICWLLNVAMYLEWFLCICTTHLCCVCVVVLWICWPLNVAVYLERLLCIQKNS